MAVELCIYRVRIVSIHEGVEAWLPYLGIDYQTDARITDPKGVLWYRWSGIISEYNLVYLAPLWGMLYFEAEKMATFAAALAIIGGEPKRVKDKE
jgi:hypothetical protein